ncbi:acetyl-CoA carboxylase biotin carboxyl carrier protein [Alkalicaulis satelles]|uniref:Biotin carboxyl carrier protein of acetyl-CoA carboxylase n=1 Tax=Alkalicaulis satelles TaxID=2609175 RepID=A0A5M6ZAL5_9PROT|nr:acetyl-CoA carboxylase biotin carboxyl carrier protein [Alkalicaulis satelles]KAA5801736.1 acetyl-CoA carboxylase biotin carboxyl carrier protein [Alkalicaulis satelles]
MASTPSRPQSDAKFVRELAKILNDTDLTEIEVEHGDLKIRVARELPAAPAVHYAAAPAVTAAPAPAMVSTPAPAPAPAAAAEAKADPKSHAGAVNSPMVGTCYLRPSPDADAFKKTGDTVKEGETILLIEAMKTFNPITAPRSGKLAEILVEDAQPVEYGEPLFVII